MVIDEELPVLSSRIRELVELDAVSSPSLLIQMEWTLTDGYAYALAIEGERIRIEKRIGELVRELKDPDRAEELAVLAEELSVREVEFDELRRLLVALRDRIELVRAAAAA